ncbi:MULTISPECIES: GntR family transcriptional regulator [Paracoccus]|uniref:FCD domain-containing protein n=1 Tax=Paracoccus litorisediminis TaxID=2006130 RepID=A0A844HMK2_9RHOB|nr:MULTISPECIES: GntR family transcriptional regulator [Paracoccus]MBD9527673.1 GntR family transcriptional regulator [Paracoccus sp. PAR01]MTH60309.1 FCD domain-containing protein [Paracoccus litorisediminis]
MDALTAEQIAERIWLSIAERRLRPGMRLKEAELAEVFGISRARVRQVLAMLEREGLVTSEVNKGAFVAEPNVEEARDIFHIRRSVEQRVIERLMDRLDESKLDAMVAHVEQERVANAENDQRAIIKLSGGFHMMLAEMAQADFLCGLMRDLIGRSSLITAAFRDSDKYNCGPDEHEEIITHLRSGDVKAAKKAMAHHLDHVEKELRLSGEREAAKSLKDALLGGA